MHAFDILGDPVRRRILEILADKDAPSSGAIVEVIAAEFGISQSAVSQHLKLLRDNGFASVAWSERGGTTDCRQSRWKRWNPGCPSSEFFGRQNLRLFQLRLSVGSAIAGMTSPRTCVGWRPFDKCIVNLLCEIWVS